MVIGKTLETLFGQSRSGQISDLLAKQSHISVRCAKVLKESACKALDEVIDLEHEGDATEEKIHELIDNSFILRFDKSDISNLATNLDNILDGMRQVVTHVDMYQRYLTESKPEADELLKVIEEMTETLRKLTDLLSGRISMAQVKEYTRQLKKSEAAADAIFYKAVAKLVREYGEKNETLSFTAHEKVFRILEHVTDVANHCGNLILSIARKEA